MEHSNWIRTYEVELTWNCTKEFLTNVSRIKEFDKTGYKLLKHK